MTTYNEQQKRERGYYAADRDHANHRARMRWWLKRARRLKLARKAENMDKELLIADEPLHHWNRRFKGAAETLIAASTADLLKAVTHKTPVKA